MIPEEVRTKARLCPRMLALTMLAASVPAAEGPPAATVTETVVPTGPYHFGVLRFVTSGNHAMELTIQLVNENG